jgi:hypothetical protein
MIQRARQVLGNTRVGRIGIAAEEYHEDEHLIRALGEGIHEYVLVVAIDFAKAPLDVVTLYGRAGATARGEADLHRCIDADRLAGQKAVDQPDAAARHGADICPGSIE